VPVGQWDAYLPTLLEPMIAALPNAIAELKALLHGANAAPDQTARERAAQSRRLVELRALMGG
jgi:hypothetical protein